MTYKELETMYPEKEFGDVTVRRIYDYPLTGQKDNWGYDKRDISASAEVIDKGWQFQLPHSCDEWVIGDEEAAEEMAKNLREAIEYTKSFIN